MVRKASLNASAHMKLVYNSSLQRCVVTRNVMRHGVAGYRKKITSDSDGVRLFVMCPHSDDLHNPAIFKNLINKPMLNCDTPGVCPSQITDKFFVPRRSLEGVWFEDLEKFFCLRFQAGRRQLFSIFLCLRGVDQSPLHHQAGSGEHFSTGVRNPRRMDSRIFGIESKYSVSWMASQSSIETRTPAFFLPTIWIGSCDFSDSARSFVILGFLAVTTL